MAIIRVHPGVDRQGLEHMARGLGCAVGHQGGFTVLLTPCETMQDHERDEKENHNVHAAIRTKAN